MVLQKGVLVRIFLLDNYRSNSCSGVRSLDFRHYIGVARVHKRSLVPFAFGYGNVAVCPVSQVLTLVQIKYYAVSVIEVVGTRVVAVCELRNLVAVGRFHK